MSRPHEKLREMILAGELAEELDVGAHKLLVTIARAASVQEWNEFAEANFALDAMPPVLLSSDDMELVRGGKLPSVDQLLRATSN